MWGMFFWLWKKHFFLVELLECTTLIRTPACCWWLNINYNFLHLLREPWTIKLSKSRVHAITFSVMTFWFFSTFFFQPQADFRIQYVSKLAPKSLFSLNVSMFFSVIAFVIEKVPWSPYLKPGLVNMSSSDGTGWRIKVKASRLEHFFHVAKETQIVSVSKSRNTSFFVTEKWKTWPCGSCPY